MITDFILSTLLGLVQGLFSLVPSWGFDSSSVNAASSVSLSAASLDGWVPETFIFACLLLVIAIRLWFLVVNALQWVYHLIPFNGG